MGHWAFSDAHIIGLKLFGLPIEEILFFVVVPFSCLLIWEMLNYLIKNEFNPNEKFFNYIPIIGTLIIILAFLFIQLEYTFIVLLAVGFSIIYTSKKTILFKQKKYYYFILITFILFLIFNYILTSIPIVTYNPSTITNIRITTIPLEDFFYNFALLTLYLTVYENSKKTRKKINS